MIRRWHSPRVRRPAALLGALVLAAAMFLGGCATINVDARGYRKYWEPFVAPSDQTAQGGARPAQVPNSADDPTGG